jgi:hypothetical protein
MLKNILFIEKSKRYSIQMDVLDSLSNTELEYYDDKFPDDCQIEYALKAIDDFHNISELSNTIPVNIPFPENKYAIDLKEVGVSGNMMIKMNWSLLNPKDPGLSTPYSYELFRSVGNDELTFIKLWKKAKIIFLKKWMLKTSSTITPSG